MRYVVYGMAGCNICEELHKLMVSACNAGRLVGTTEIKLVDNDPLCLADLAYIGVNPPALCVFRDGEEDPIYAKGGINNLTMIKMSELPGAKSVTTQKSAPEC
jgi:hypothetical protein